MSERKKKARFSATGKSRKLLEQLGYTVASVEQTVRIPSKQKEGEWEMFKRDLFGIGDLLCIRDNEPGVLIVQCTTVSNQANRITKIKGISATYTLLRSKNRLYVHGWKPGTRKKPARLTVTELYIEQHFGEIKTRILPEFDGQDTQDETGQKNMQFDAVDDF